ncbi:solute carrier family 35 member E3 isoform X2 [Hydra vulgaris]|uniref:Solute carrier family 35 member E3 isoform X2 n=1 Tax=Hydra vulgaris TaxID=6087 RepID=A0ABM4CJW7_HYDVU
MTLQHSSFLVTFCVLLNICSSICIVMINKWIYTYYHFPNITLTCIHFIITSLGLKVCSIFNLFNPRYVPIKSMLPLSVAFCGFVVFTNLSLEYNTVGTYQLIKVLTTPCIMIIHVMFYKKTYTLKILLTLIPITFGVFLNSYYDVKFNLFGALIAGFGVIITSLYQVWVGTTQQDLGIDSMQLLSYQAPLSAGLLLFIIPFFEPLSGEGSLFHMWSMQTWLLVGLSGCIAFSINLTIFWIIGNLSPVTYNMVGHLKFCATLLFGYILFHDNIMISQLFGIASTLIGVLMYTHFKLQEQPKKVSLSRQV